MSLQPLNETAEPKLQIRPFKLDDLDQLLALEQACFPTDPYPAEAFLHYARRWPQWFLVATVDNQLVGYALASRVGNRAELVSIAVHPNWQGRRIGRRLIDAIEQLLREGGVTELWLSVRTTNQKARVFYERRGFQHRRLIRRYYPDGGDAFRMSKRLN